MPNNNGGPETGEMGSGRIFYDARKPSEVWLLIVVLSKWVCVCTVQRGVHVSGTTSPTSKVHGG